MKRFLENQTRDVRRRPRRSSFENLTEDQLEAHLSVDRYGDFRLTDAVRPSFNLEVVPREGYRHDEYVDPETGVSVPVLMAAASRERLVDLFFDLVDEVGDEVDVVLESSHENSAGGHEDLIREHIDLPVLKSILLDHEDVLLDDGCTGVAVLNSQRPVEVQFDEHKLLIVYGHELHAFQQVLDDYGIPGGDDVRFITEAEHVHSSTDEQFDQFRQLCTRLGIDD